MAVTFQILPRRGLVYVRFSDVAVVAESFEALGRLAQEPDYRPDQNQLIDLSAVTGIEAEYVEMLKLHAMKAEMFTANDGHMLIVYIAPTDIALRLATLISRSWDGVDGITSRIARSEVEALDILGIAHDAIAPMLQEKA